MQRRVLYTYDISRQSTSINMVPTKTNVMMLDTTTLLSLLVITVFIVQVFSLTINTNNVQTLIGRKSNKRSLTSSLSDARIIRRHKRMWEEEYSWRNKFKKRNSLPFGGHNNNFDAYDSSEYGYQSNQYSPPSAMMDNYGGENPNVHFAQDSVLPSNGLTDGITYVQERMSDLFLDTGYENIYLAIGVAATALFVIETLVRVYRIYEANNKRRKRRKRSNLSYPEDIETQFKHIINAIITGYDNFEHLMSENIYEIPIDIN